MKRYKLINNVTGWIVFIISACVYLLTMEPTASFWDCGEFISTAFKLEVGHPPGAPFFNLLGNIFTLLAAGDTSKVAIMVNASSALSSAFTILFLFWTITHLARKFYNKAIEELSNAQIAIIIGSGLVGAFAYTFSDSFWFSAVEGEVYAMSSLFTALVFWAILKWEDNSDGAHANKWIILIAYLMGLSIGVHLLNLLAIPAIVFVYYFKKYPVTKKGILITTAISVALLGTVMYGVIQGSVVVASWFDLLFVNGFGLPYNSGLLFFVFLIAAILGYAIHYTHKKSKVLWNTILLVVAMLMLGYSSYALIVVRSLANTPLNENAPNDAFALLSYLNREQYGDRPLIYGQTYNAPMDHEDEGSAIYTSVNGKYEVTSHRPKYVYDERFVGLFPRMYSPDPNHVEAYKSWANIQGESIRVKNPNTGESEIIKKPTFGENLKFFFRYQVGYMYLRYFFWNFAGRQNDIQGNGEATKGNWISGIKFLDELRLGSQDNLPDELANNKARNKYYMLPFLLGIIGLMVHYQKNKKDFTIVLWLFIMTGLAIVVYLNQTPYQPRERDYAYAGSFYAYAIWIGLGVIGLYELIRKIPDMPKAIALTGLCLVLVPGIMASENWDDHNRSNRYTCRDFAYNYLTSCAPNAIIFTNGDNDTFPLWYAQEVEGYRTDVRVVNLSYLGADWYISQMKNKAYKSEPVPFTLDESKYRQGTRDLVYLLERYGNKPLDLREGMQFLASDLPGTKRYGNYQGRIDHLPAKNFFLPVDSALVLKTGTVSAAQAKNIVPQLNWSINRNYITKSDMMVLDLLANNNWQRPIYWAVTVSRENFLNLDKYFQCEGLAYHLVPISSGVDDKNQQDNSGINTEVMYDNLMNKFKWGGINNPKVYLDENNLRMLSNIRNHFARLAGKLIDEGKKDSAKKVLDRCFELMPNSQVPFNHYVLPLVEQYYRLNDTQTAVNLTNQLFAIAEKNIKYYYSLGEELGATVDFEKQIALHIMVELARMTETYGQPELSKTMQEKLQVYYEKYATSQQRRR
jgi:hypothetical protein